jgi:methylenetetrahydrofolate reductase (NADPH)
MTSPDAEPTPRASDLADPVARVAAFAQDASFETTKLTADEIAQVKSATPSGKLIYVASIPSKPLGDQIDTAKGLHEAGFEVVPHLAARNFESEGAMEDHLRRLVAEAGVRRALVIAGDRPTAVGPLPDALAIIKTGALQRHGIVEIGISGYPDGHPRISEADLDRAMADKLAAAERAGLRVRIVTQFTMSTEPVVDLIARLRQRGINNLVSIGLAGPTSMTTLLKFARVCGVKASTSGLMRNIGLVKNLIGASTADPIVRALAERRGELGDINPHFFSFGGLPATTRWVTGVAAKRITLTAEGFEVAAAR